MRVLPTSCTQWRRLRTSTRHLHHNVTIPYLGMADDSNPANCSATVPPRQILPRVEESITDDLTRRDNQQVGHTQI